MKFNSLKEAAQFRINESEESYWIEDYWKAATKIFTENISDTIRFFQNDCTDEEFYWLSEIFEDIAEQTPSRELVAALRSRLAAVTPENYRQENFSSEHMRRGVDFAEYVRSVGIDIDYADGVAEAMLYNAEAARQEKGGANDENNDCRNSEGTNPHIPGN